MSQTKFGNHLSMSSVGGDVWMYFFLMRPLKLVWPTLLDDYLRMLQTKFGYHPSLISEEADVWKYFFFMI
jgi:hypothetical protein